MLNNKIQPGLPKFVRVCKQHSGSFGVKLNRKDLSCIKAHGYKSLMSQFNWELPSADRMFSLGAVLTLFPWRAQMCYLNFSTICT